MSEVSLVPALVLTDFEQRVLALKLAYPGVDSSLIAERLDVSVHKVRKAIRNPNIQHFLNEVQNSILEEAKDLLVASSLDAVRTLRMIARGEGRDGQLDLLIPYAVQRQAAKDILDILRHQRPEEKNEEDVVWETGISTVGIVVGQKVKSEISKELSPADQKQLERFVEEAEDAGEPWSVLSES